MTDYKTYLVTLTIFIGAYEKVSHQLVEAEDEDDARARAYACEQHCDDAEYDDDAQAFVDCDGEMAYRVNSCVEVPWQHAVVLRKYYQNKTRCELSYIQDTSADRESWRESMDKISNRPMQNSYYYEL